MLTHPVCMALRDQTHGFVRLSTLLTNLHSQALISSSFVLGLLFVCLFEMGSFYATFADLDITM